MVFDAVPSRILHILGRSGIKGVTVVKCKVMDGPDRGKIITRNVLGPVKEGDIILLRETEMESAASMGRR